MVRRAKTRALGIVVIEVLLVVLLALVFGFFFNPGTFCCGETPSVASSKLPPTSTTHANTIIQLVNGGEWHKTNGFPLTMDWLSCEAYNSLIFCKTTADSGHGGEPTRIYYAQLSPIGVDAWQNTTYYPSEQTAVANVNCTNSGGTPIYFNDYVYCIGGFLNTTQHYIAYWPYTSASYYTILANNNRSSGWRATTPYPTPILWPSCVVNSSGTSFCVGGAISCPDLMPCQTPNTTYYAELSSAGIGAWKNVTSNYPFDNNGYPRPQCVFDSGYIYCVGDGFGLDGPNATYYARVD